MADCSIGRFTIGDTLACQDNTQEKALGEELCRMLYYRLTMHAAISGSGATLPEEALIERELNRSGQPAPELDPSLPVAGNTGSRRSMEVSKEPKDIEMGMPAEVPHSHSRGRCHALSLCCRASR